MAYCGKCGVQVNEDNLFCSSCGAPLKNSDSGKQGQNTQGQNKQNNFADNIGVNAEKAYHNAKEFINNTKDTTYQYHPEDIKRAKVVSAFAYVWILFFLPLVICPDSKYGRFHANQGLVFLITSAIVGVVTAILDSIIAIIFKTPVIWNGLYTTAYTVAGAGVALISILSSLIGIAMFVLMILGIVNAATGKAKELPLIGKIKIIK